MTSVAQLSWWVLRVPDVEETYSFPTLSDIVLDKTKEKKNKPTNNFKLNKLLGGNKHGACIVNIGWGHFGWVGLQKGHLRRWNFWWKHEWCKDPPRWLMEHSFAKGPAQQGQESANTLSAWELPYCGKQSAQGAGIWWGWTSMQGLEYAGICGLTPKIFPKLPSWLCLWKSVLWSDRTVSQHSISRQHLSNLYLKKS